MRWICCQIGAREHYAVARALHRQNALDLLVTDTWVLPNNTLGRLNVNLRTRFHPDLTGAAVYAPRIGSLTFEARARLAGMCGWNRIVARNHWFQKIAVERLSRVNCGAGSRTVMAYSYAALG